MVTRYRVSLHPRETLLRGSGTGWIQVSVSVGPNEGVARVPVSPNGKGVPVSLSEVDVVFVATRTSEGGMALI